MVELVYSTIQASKDGNLMKALRTKKLDEAFNLLIAEVCLITTQSGGDSTIVLVEVEADLSHDGGMS